MTEEDNPNEFAIEFGPVLPPSDGFYDGRHVNATAGFRRRVYRVAWLAGGEDRVMLAHNDDGSYDRGRLLAGFRRELGAEPSAATLPWRFPVPTYPL